MNVEKLNVTELNAQEMRTVESGGPIINFLKRIAKEIIDEILPKGPQL